MRLTSVSASELWLTALDQARAADANFARTFYGSSHCGSESRCRDEQQSELFKREEVHDVLESSCSAKIGNCECLRKIAQSIGVLKYYSVIFR